VLFYGNFERLLAADPSATLLRQVLDRTFSDYLHNLLGKRCPSLDITFDPARFSIIFCDQARRQKLTPLEVS
jgi:hypothetical protein